MNINRRQAIKLTSATVIGGGISLFSLQSAFASGQWLPPPSGLTRYVIFDIQTGEDDLRGGSNISAFIGLGSINTEWLSDANGNSLNKGASWGNWTRNRGLLDLGSWRIVGDIQELSLSFITGLGGPFDGPDNWNLQTLFMHCMVDFFGEPPDPNFVDLNTAPLLFKGEGNPFIRFKAYENSSFLTQR
jgi:hypothetical protein